jgi:formylglycine-generating enzyme
MGSQPNERSRNDDETPHQVTLTKGFYLGKHEITQAQWEYACRAGTTTAYSLRDSTNTTLANYGKGFTEGTKSVNQYPPNPWGFHDMHGNLWEWCADWYGDYPNLAVVTPTGPASCAYRVWRGGSWGGWRYFHAFRQTL